LHFLAGVNENDRTDGLAVHVLPCSPTSHLTAHQLLVNMISSSLLLLLLLLLPSARLPDR